MTRPGLGTPKLLDIQAPLSFGELRVESGLKPRIESSFGTRGRGMGALA